MSLNRNISLFVARILQFVILLNIVVGTVTTTPTTHVALLSNFKVDTEEHENTFTVDQNIFNVDTQDHKNAFNVDTEDHKNTLKVDAQGHEKTLKVDAKDQEDTFRFDIEDHENAYEMAEVYNHCYQVFTDHYFGASFHELCLIREKLNLCTKKVKVVYPTVDEIVVKGAGGLYEFVAKFWCIHKPYQGIPIAALWYKYNHCPNVHSWFMVLPEDYSATVRMAYTRARFAAHALKSITLPWFTQWRPQQKYTDPTNAIYQALSRTECAIHHYHEYNAQIVDRYCFIGDVDRDLTEKLSHYSQINLDGLYGWNSSLCYPNPADPIQKLLNVCNLRDSFKSHVNSSLGQCHASTVAVRGATCLIMFYTQVVPYSDRHLFMSGFCKPIKELHECWENVVQLCPKSSFDSGVEVMIKLHQFACNLSLENSVDVWDTIYKWAGAVKKIKGSQVLLQQLAISLNAITNQPYRTSEVLSLPFASTLNRTLNTQLHMTPNVQSIFQQIVLYLDRINLIYTYRFQGLNVLHNISQDTVVNDQFAGTIIAGLLGPVEQLLTTGGFIEYDPTNFVQWTFMY